MMILALVSVLGQGLQGLALSILFLVTRLLLYDRLKKTRRKSPQHSRTRKQSVKTFEERYAAKR